MTGRVLVVGAGVAAASLCRTLRQMGFDGEIVLLSAEQYLPYERPALTKSILSGRKTIADIALLSREQVSELQLNVRLGVAATAIDVDALHVTTSDSRVEEYDKLVIAVGLRPRRLPGTSVGMQHHAIRSIDDVERLRPMLGAARRVAIIGAGWLGLETAALLSDQGHAVTVIDAAPGLCSRNAPEQIGQQLEAFHLRRGVTLRLGSPIEKITFDDGASTIQVDGEPLTADIVIEAIGVFSEPIPSCGRLDWTVDGIPVDALLRTNCPGVYAIGDVTRVKPRLTGETIRMETWANAVAQGEHLARVLMGDPTPFALESWFWSDQADLNVQVIGMPSLADTVEEEIRAPEHMMVRYLKGGKLVGAASINEFRGMKIARRDIDNDMFVCA